MCCVWNDNRTLTSTFHITDVYLLDVIRGGGGGDDDGVDGDGYHAEMNECDLHRGAILWPNRIRVYCLHT